MILKQSEESIPTTDILSNRLHVKISDTNDQQYTIPDSVFERPSPAKGFDAKKADLQFNFERSPFAFWITRRSAPHATPLFDTRPASLPKTPSEATVSNGDSVSIDDYSLKFEDQYLEVMFPFLESETSLMF